MHGVRALEPVIRRWDPYPAGCRPPPPPGDGARPLPNQTWPPAAELMQQVRHEFQQPVEEGDLYARKYRLSDGRTRLKMLSEMLAMQL